MEDEVVKNETQATPNEKPTYEDLNNWCYQLAEQNRKLKAQVQSMNLTNAFKRQDYLFEIINIARDNTYLFPEEIVERAVQETVEFLFPNDAEDVENNGENE
jgi:hypothetical protein